jgi:predicted TIM-barrel fold metal-dependent hydrolase
MAVREVLSLRRRSARRRPIPQRLCRHGNSELDLPYEFHNNGFNSHIQNNVVKAKYPERFLLCGSFDPRDEEAGIEAFHRMVAGYPIQGLKLYTAEWRNGVI